MARLTRNSYKRKIILFAVFVFISIALISTGFAAWVMSSDAQLDASGNVEVGLVSDSSLKIELTYEENDVKIENFSFLFEPAAGDKTGRVRLDNDELSESLVYTIKGKISNPQILAENGLTIKMGLPEGMQKAIDLNYIVAPECASSEKVITVEDDGTFEYKLEFKWGSAFGDINPSLYFDNNEEGLKVSDADVKIILENLRACVYNYYDALTADGANRAEIIAQYDGEGETVATPKFKVTLVAKAN